MRLRVVALIFFVWPMRVLAGRATESFLRAGTATAALDVSASDDATGRSTADASTDAGVATFGRLKRRAHHRRASSRQMPPPLYIPKIGLANVTTPTAFPPPPPQLDPWKDGQPIDTAIGAAVVNHFAPEITSTPPPTQASLDLAFGCPVLLGWPSQLEVEAPNECRGNGMNGSWFSQGSDAPIINWGKACNVFTKNLAPLVTYSLPNGDMFGTSQSLTTLFATEVVLRDCAWNVKYTVIEKRFWQEGKPDADACEKYGSCIGIVFLQYFIKDANDNTIANTAYLNLFQDTFKILGAGGAEVATVMRMGGWSPMDKDKVDTDNGCGNGDPKRWLVRFADTPPGVFNSATEQWPIAEMMTMMAMRDINRMPTGMCRPDSCEITRGVLIFSFSFIGAVALVVLFIVFKRVLLFSLIKTMQEIETQFCPKRMVKPSKYAG